ncbi:MAG: hypothetical protein HZA90_11990 [Verrucomicrobia bacterium]|nr:hypothetical protein [Verrucomicrobiota bacterium]
MNRTLKIVIYAVLVVATCLFAWKFVHAYRSMKPVQIADEDVPEAVENVTTNAARSTNVAASPPSSTNLTKPALASGTNAAVADTNTPQRGLATAKRLGREGASFVQVIGYGGVMLIVLICLGVMLAHDFSHIVAERFTQFILDDDGEARKDPAYERAEQMWANDEFLDAIQLMRDYLKEHPQKLYVALRIAEIYEKNLNNHLAAALEYEEVLRHRLLPEQWGWTAIHLVNLYFGKLDKPDKAVALLRRIVSEYGETAAAGKARSRLAQMEGEPPEAATEEAAPPEPAPPPPEPAKPASNLPKGFRPRSK